MKRIMPLFGWLAIAIAMFIPLAARAEVVMDEDTKKATAKGLEWLARAQNADGSFSDGGYSHNSAINST